MVMLEVNERFAQRLRDLAAQDNAPLETVLWQMLETYTASRQHTPSDEAFEAMAGMFKDDVTDMSTTVPETMEAYYREKYGNPD